MYNCYVYPDQNTEVNLWNHSCLSAAQLRFVVKLSSNLEDIFPFEQITYCILSITIIIIVVLPGVAKSAVPFSFGLSDSESPESHETYS